MTGRELSTTLNRFKEPKYNPETSDYWRTPEGINQRLDMLGSQFTYMVVNNSLKMYGDTYGASGMMWVTHPEASKTGPCQICSPKHGRIYKPGQFMPPMPAHARCVCQWEIIWSNPAEPPYQPPTEPSGESLIRVS